MLGSPAAALCYAISGTNCFAPSTSAAEPWRAVRGGEEKSSLGPVVARQSVALPLAVAVFAVTMALFPVTLPVVAVLLALAVRAVRDLRCLGLRRWVELAGGAGLLVALALVAGDAVAAVFFEGSVRDGSDARFFGSGGSDGGLTHLGSRRSLRLWSRRGRRWSWHCVVC
jgi:hypothetical protein